MNKGENMESESPMFPFKVIIEMDRLFETKEEAQDYLMKFYKFDESVKERI